MVEAVSLFILIVASFVMGAIYGRCLAQEAKAIEADVEAEALSLWARLKIWFLALAIVKFVRRFV